MDTKFNINDEVWLMFQNQPQQATIRKIHIQSGSDDIFDKSTVVIYEFYTDKGEKYGASENVVFAKKEELRDYVLKSFGLQPNDYNENFLKVKIVDTDLSVRALNCLKWLDITTLGDLIKRSPNDLWAIRNFGRKTMIEINNLLDEYGLKLASEALKDKAKRPIILV